MSAHSAECWTRVRCPVHGVLMPPRGRSAPLGMANCEHQQMVEFNFCHLWGPDDPDAWMTDPTCWSLHNPA